MKDFPQANSKDLQVKPKSLQHALRSHLQGAMLYLDLIKEDAQSGKLSLDDIDSAIESLHRVVGILDEQRSEESKSD